MTRRILINGRRAEEVRVAIVENQTLDDYEIETRRSGLLRNNIYRGVVANIAPSLNAAFVDFGDVKNGFLAFNDVVESAYCRPVKDAYRISDVLVPGQEIIVQVIKDAGGPKGAQVTTNISLAGRYLVLRPKDAKSGVSRKVDDDARADLTQKVRSLDLPEGYGCIVRTNAMDQSRAILLRDAKALVQLWHKIEAEAARGNGPQLLYNDQDIVVSVMRDYFDSSINEVLIDDKSCYERAMTYVKATIASGKEKIKLYEDKMPIFSRFGIEKQIEQIYARQVALPSGGYIVIDPTEALTAIDVNSAHATKRENQDLTAYHTNLEAATEIGRQLRMRDIGGLIVVDFIDMRSGKHQRDVERVMRNAMARDKARNKVERISANGLLEINRQRISQALSQRMHLTCPTCGGRGTIPSAEAIGMNLMREIDARAANGNLGGVNIKLHPDIAQQLQNERRREFAQIENEYDIRIEIIATREMSRGEEAIEWLTRKQADALYPEKSVQRDTASIIDVAEVYQNQDEIDDAYRPNDYEEFSSDDARRKRASRRAQRREAICTDCEESTQQSACVADDAESKCMNEDSSTRKRNRREERKEECREARFDERREGRFDERREGRFDERRESSRREERRDGGAPSQRSLRTGAAEAVQAPDSHRLPGIGIASGLIALSVFIEAMAPYMNDANGANGPEDRSRRRFSARRRTFKKEAGAGMDYRMFTLDLVKAVCVRAFGMSTEMTRKDLVSQMPEVSRYFEVIAQKPEDERLAIVSDLRIAITSRHASARLSCIFDANPDAQADEMAAMLVQARDNVITSMTTRGAGECRSAAESTIGAALERVFGAAKAVAERVEASDAEISSAEVERAEESYTVADAVAESEEVVRHPEVAIATVPVAERRGSRQRQRSNRRAAIGAQAQDGSAEETPCIVDDGVVVTADVEIAPMTRLDDVKTTAETASEAHQDEDLEPTLEMPRVSRERRRDRRSRDRRNMASETVDSAESNAIVRDSIAETQVANEVQSTNEVQVANEVQAANDAQTGRRRERRTRRPQIGSENAGNAGNAVVMAQNGDEAANTVKQTANVESQAVKTESQEAKAERQTAKAEKQTAKADNQTAKADNQTAKVDNQTANVESQAKPAIDDKTAPKAQKSPKAERLRREAPKAERPRREAVSEPVVVAEAPQNDDNRSKRRVRKVNAAQIDTTLYAKDDVVAVNADLASADSSAVSADMGAVSADMGAVSADMGAASADSGVAERDAVEVVAPVERQPRQPRRSRSRIEAKDKTSDDLGVERKVDEPKVDDVADIADKASKADKANAADKASDKETKSTRRTRTVRARMASPTAAESEERVDVAPVAESLPVVDNSPAVEDGGAQTEPASKPRRARQTRRARPGDDVQ